MTGFTDFSTIALGRMKKLKNNPLVGDTARAFAGPAMWTNFAIRPSVVLGTVW